MKNIIRALFVGIGCLIAFNSVSQSIAFYGGVNSSDVFLEMEKQLFPSLITKKTSFQFGIEMEKPLNDWCSFNYGLDFADLGFRIKGYIGDSSVDWVDGKTSLKYLHIPITIKFHHASRSLKSTYFAGPFVGLGLIGRKTMEHDGTVTYDEKVVWGPTSDYRRFDLGFNFGIGLEYASYFLNLSYGFGLRNIENINRNWKNTNRFIKVSVGYRIDLK